MDYKIKEQLEPYLATIFVYLFILPINYKLKEEGVLITPPHTTLFIKIVFFFFFFFFFALLFFLSINLFFV